MVDSLIAQRHRFGQIGDGKPVYTQSYQLVGNIFVPVTVGVGFDNSHNHAAGFEFFLDGTNIVVDAVQVNNCPAAPKKIYHDLSSCPLDACGM